MHNKGSSTVEVSVIMAVFLLSMILIIQCYFSALSRVKQFVVQVQTESTQSCNIEDAVKKLRRWQWVDEKV